MKAFATIWENFLSFKRIPMKVVVITALASYVLQMSAIIMGQPLYIIALYTLLPWIPVLLFESLWKVEHYQWIAFFAIITFSQLGHLGEHLVQVGALSVTTGTLACPPPVDAGSNYERAIEMELRPAGSQPTGYSSSIIVVPDSAGNATMDANDTWVQGPPACGVFGQLDLEIVHLLWDVMGWILTMWLLTKFPKSIWLWIAVFWSSVHTVEHVFISYTFFLSPEQLYAGARQLWATVANGAIVTAIPVGKEPAIVNFYAVAGKFGIVAKNGLIGTMFPSLNPSLPPRPWLHFYYNTLITFPTVIGFIWEMRRIYDHYLADALPNLSKEQLVAATPRLERQTYHKGDVIIRQGDISDQFFIILKGEVEVIHIEKDGSEKHIATLEHGQYFGEIGLMSKGKRIATVRAASDGVEVMALDRETFSGLMDNSAMSKDDVKRVMQKRIAEVGTD
jgi:cyclic nucleotide-binding protein